MLELWCKDVRFTLGDGVSRIRWCPTLGGVPYKQFFENWLLVDCFSIVLHKCFEKRFHFQTQPKCSNSHGEWWVGVVLENAKSAWLFQKPQDAFSYVLRDLRLLFTFIKYRRRFCRFFGSFNRRSSDLFLWFRIRINRKKWNFLRIWSKLELFEAILWRSCETHMPKEFLRNFTKIPIPNRKIAKWHLEFGRKQLLFSEKTIISEPKKCAYSSFWCLFVVGQFHHCKGVPKTVMTSMNTHDMSQRTRTVTVMFLYCLATFHTVWDTVFF